MAIHTFDEVFERLVTVIGTGQLVGLFTPAGRLTGYPEAIENSIVVFCPLAGEGIGMEPLRLPMRHISAVAYITPATAHTNRWTRL